MRGPQAYRRYVYIDVLAGLKLPGASDLECNPKAIAWKGLNLGLGATIFQNPVQANDTLQSPNNKNDLDNLELVEVVISAVDPDTSKANGCK